MQYLYMLIHKSGMMQKIYTMQQYIKCQKQTKLTTLKMLLATETLIWSLNLKPLCRRWVGVS